MTGLGAGSCASAAAGLVARSSTVAQSVAKDPRTRTQTPCTRQPQPGRSSFVKGAPIGRAALLQLCYHARGGKDAPPPRDGRGATALLLHIFHSGLTPNLRVGGGFYCSMRPHRFLAPPGSPKAALTRARGARFPPPRRAAARVWGTAGARLRAPAAARRAAPPRPPPPQDLLAREDLELVGVNIGGWGTRPGSRWRTRVVALLHVLGPWQAAQPQCVEPTHPQAGTPRRWSRTTAPAAAAASTSATPQTVGAACARARWGVACRMRWELLESSGLWARHIHAHMSCDALRGAVAQAMPVVADSHCRCRRAAGRVLGHLPGVAKNIETKRWSLAGARLRAACRPRLGLLTLAHAWAFAVLLSSLLHP
jgi:hypothetical protein